MNTLTIISIILMWTIIFIGLRNRKRIVAKKIIEKRKMEGNIEMKELAKKFIDKKCIIYAFDSNHQYSGIIKDVSDSAILI